MSEDRDALLALKNAWAGVLSAADRLRETRPGALDSAATASIGDVDLEACAGVVLAQANAAQALRGLIEQLRRKGEKSAQARE
jgi:hypothetical protein